MLSTTTEHALRALSHLASTPSQGSLLGRELSERASVPSTYLSKIMLTLRNAGIVIATRGFGGGYRLLREPEAITLMEIVELFEGRRSRPRCVLGYGICSEEKACGAHKAWCALRDMQMQFLQNTTLADISRSPLSRKKSRRRKSR